MCMGEQVEQFLRLFHRLPSGSYAYTCYMYRLQVSILKPFVAVPVQSKSALYCVIDGSICTKV